MVSTAAMSFKSADFESVTGMGTGIRGKFGDTDASSVNAPCRKSCNPKCSISCSVKHRVPRRAFDELGYRRYE